MNELNLSILNRKKLEWHKIDLVRLQRVNENLLEIFSFEKWTKFELIYKHFITLAFFNWFIKHIYSFYHRREAQESNIFL